MKLAILSGKGGTGKTTISTNLALALKFNYIDCDVEEPNGFIFLKPEIESEEHIRVDYPLVDDKLCNQCGLCVKHCAFNALTNVKEDILLFQKLCHGCGVCEWVCPQDAIHYEKRVVGKIQIAKANQLTCQQGILNISEPMAVPIIKNLLQNTRDQSYVIDCPPGTSCNVVNTLQYASAAILVTEPTKFGLNDLERAVALVKKYKIPFGIIINKDDGQENLIRQFAEREKIQILDVLSYSLDIAKSYAKGDLLYKLPVYQKKFEDMAEIIKEAFQWS